MARVKLSESKAKKIKEICAAYGNKAGEAINVLHQVQGEFGYLPAEVQELIPYIDMHGNGMLCKRSGKGSR